MTRGAEAVQCYDHRLHISVIRELQKNACPEDDQGLVYAVLMTGVLEELEKEGKIRGFSLVDQEDELRRQGIRFFIYPNSGLRVPLRTTSTENEARKKLREKEKIPTLALLDSELGNEYVKTNDELKRRIMQLIYIFEKYWSRETRYSFV